MTREVEDTKRVVYFQDHMPENVCYGCGQHNDEGLRIKSYWANAEEAWCAWRPQAHHHGWRNVLNGGLIATLIDCHCMCTAMAYAYKQEGRALDSEPIYRYATGTLHIRYLRPTPHPNEVLLKARVTETKGKKTVLNCELYAGKTLTAQAEVVALRVYDSGQDNQGNPFRP